MVTELFLIRHAQTEYNRRKRYCSFTDVALNKKGLAQVLSLRDKKKIPRPDIIFCSCFKRTQQTARKLFPRRKIRSTSALKELNFGRWEGLSYEQIISFDKERYCRWIDDPYHNRPPQGEKLSDLEKRVMGFLSEILKQYAGKKIVCISHAGPIKIMISDLLNKKMKNFWDIEVETASINYFKLKNNKVVLYRLKK